MGGPMPGGPLQPQMAGGPGPQPNMMGGPPRGPLMGKEMTYLYILNYKRNATVFNWSQGHY